MTSTTIAEAALDRDALQRRALAPPREMSALENWLRIGFGLFYLGVVTVVFMALLVPFVPFRAMRIRIGNVYGTVAGRGVVWFSGSKVEVSGYQEAVAAGPAIYVANHVTPLDVFTGIWLSPPGCSGIAKKQIVNYPFFGQMYWLSGHLRIDRETRDKAVASLQALAPFVLRHKLSVWIWPEGTRSRDGRLLPFKKGFAHLALATKLPIVPIVIHGGQHAWDNGSVRLRKADIRIECLPPVDTSAWRKETLEEHIRAVEQIYVERLSVEQKPLVWERGEAKAHTRTA